MQDRYQQIIDVLAQSRRVLITTHARPDGDALGSAAALSLGLRQKGIASEVLLLTHLPRKYGFIFHDHKVVHHDAEKGWPAALSLDAFDTLVVCDTGTWSQLPGLRERVENWPARKIIIDHHLTQEAWGDLRLVETKAAAAGEIVSTLLSRWGVKIDHPIAEALYLAIVTDTGWFQFSNTHPRTLRLAADLMEIGVNTDRMYQAIYQNERAARFRLQMRAMQSVELPLEGRLAVMTLWARDFVETGAGFGDTENLINIPLQIATVQASVLVVEPPEGGDIRVSLRSKGLVDVARFAEVFGGGGHARAAGLKQPPPTGDVKKRIVAAMTEQLQRINGIEPDED